MTRIMTGTASCRDLAALSQGAASLPPSRSGCPGCAHRICRRFLSSLTRWQISRRRSTRPSWTILRFCCAKAASSATARTRSSTSCAPVQSGGKGMLTQIEAREKEKTGIRNLRVGYNRVFGYYIEVAKGQLNLVPDSYIRKQTLSTGERYITEELKELESTILTAKDRIVALEYDLFVALRQFVAGESARVKQTAQAVAQLDVLCSFAAVAVHNHYCKPEVDLGNTVSITAGRHPVVEQMLKNALFVPNDTLLGSEDCRTAIITGPNMAGKSTYIAAGGAHRPHGADGLVRPGAVGAHRHCRPAVYAHRCIGRSGLRPVDIHGRDDRGCRYSEKRDAAFASHPRRDRQRHVDVRRHGDRKSRARIRGRPQAAGRENALRHALSRADGH